MYITWHHYDTELALYESIAQSPFYSVFDDCVIDATIGRELLYAMTKNRPILVGKTPRFTKTAQPFVRDTITSHMTQFHVVKLSELDPRDLITFIEKLAPCDYRLTESEGVLINSHVKAHFRRLLDEARDVYVSKLV
jgi:hypothetical protein